jgi:hypothetical protein
MSKAELLIYCREIYQREGIKAFAFDALLNHRSLYRALYKQGLTQGKLIDELGLSEEYATFKDAQPLIRAGGVTRRWTWARIVETAKAVTAREGFLPPGGWFQAVRRGHDSFSMDELFPAPLGAAANVIVLGIRRQYPQHYRLAQTLEILDSHRQRLCRFWKARPKP